MEVRLTRRRAIGLAASALAGAAVLGESRARAAVPEVIDGPRSDAFSAVLAVAASVGLGGGVDQAVAAASFRDGYSAMDAARRRGADAALDRVASLPETQGGPREMTALLRAELGGRDEPGPTGLALHRVLEMAVGVLTPGCRTPAREQVAIAAGWW